MRWNERIRISLIIINIRTYTVKYLHHKRHLDTLTNFHKTNVDKPIRPPSFHVVGITLHCFFLSVVPEAGNDLYAEGAPENRANQQKFSKESAVATDGSTKQNGTTKQKANEEQVEARSTEHPTEETKEPSVHINKGQGHVSFRPSDTTAKYVALIKGLGKFGKILLTCDLNTKCKIKDNLKV